MVAIFVESSKGLGNCGEVLDDITQPERKQGGDDRGPQDADDFPRHRMPGHLRLPTGPALSAISATVCRSGRSAPACSKISCKSWRAVVIFAGPYWTSRILYS